MKKMTTMKISRGALTRIIAEELRRITEAPEDADAEKPEEPPVSSPKKGGAPEKKPSADAGPPPEDDPADDKLSKQAAGEDDGTGKLADQLQGKTISSVALEKKSKVVPGATEVTMQFEQGGEPLRILISKSGGVSFFYGGLHNEL